MATVTEHIGHRERLRERFAKSGFEGFHDYEILEMILFFVFKQGDQKPLAKQLIKRFGSLSKVLDAPIEELQNEDGLGKNSSITIKIIRELIASYFTDRTQNNNLQLTTMSGLVEFLRSQIGGRENEVLFAIFLNAKNEVLLAKELSEGTVAQASAYPRKIVEDALKLKSTSVILAHNHPSGVNEPSDDDLRITTEIRSALLLIDVSLQEHIILSDSNYYSFARNNQL